MKIHIAALLVLIFLMGGVTTACTAETSAQLASPHVVATPLGPDLVGRNETIYWVLESEVTRSPEDTPFIYFAADGIGGKADHCGGFGAPYTYASDGKIEIGVIISQGVGCSEELTELKRQLLDTLQAVKSITRVDDRLYLEGSAGRLVFRPLRADDTDVIPESFRNPNAPIPTPTPRPYPYSQPVESTVPPPLPESPYP